MIKSCYETATVMAGRAPHSTHVCVCVFSYLPQDRILRSSSERRREVMTIRERERGERGSRRKKRALLTASQQKSREGPLPVCYACLCVLERGIKILFDRDRVNPGEVNLALVHALLVICASGPKSIAEIGLIRDAGPLPLNKQKM